MTTCNYRLRTKYEKKRVVSTEKILDKLLFNNEKKLIDLIMSYIVEECQECPFQTLNDDMGLCEHKIILCNSCMEENECSECCNCILETCCNYFGNSCVNCDKSYCDDCYTEHMYCCNLCENKYCDGCCSMYKISHSDSDDIIICQGCINESRIN